MTLNDQSKLLPYLSAGLSSVVLAAIFHVATITTATSQGQVRVEENLRQLNKQVESIQEKVDYAFFTTQQNKESLDKMKK
ncbi:hypothetical protein [Trichormus variabilis]|uniref:Uncharacterized protein n=1 Tax=Trichormus variabilis SAG 1403-4b TaxID=447716 RepID=A0A3S1A6E4_ANAVA|nr:hypothetical protein [Trichormus variabilis]MBD2629166.1 hypothetical protein [Trichormus variabilis FACHB-164]RUS94230.1 hypothetical protein DSM107003_37610 [Trichormus variabilis SAG 1403-4b]